MTIETVTLTLRGISHTHSVDSAAIDLMFAAFVAEYPPLPVPTVEGDVGFPEVTTKDNPITASEHFARRLRLYSESVTLGYVSKLDALITPNQDSISTFITSE